MHTNDSQAAEFMPKSEVSHKIALIRFTIGLVQGCILYWLYNASKFNQWPATTPTIFVSLVMLFSVIPVLAISGLGHQEPRRLSIWLAIYSVVIAGLAWHDVWRATDLDLVLNSGELNTNEGYAHHTVFPSHLLVVFSIAGMFIAHSLLLAAAQDQRRIARYQTHFEIAWKLLIQIKFSVLFVAALWLVLLLGSELFMLVKLEFLKDMLKESWFSIPVTVFAFSCAMHITDVRPAIVRGIRGLLLVLMSWILPIAVLLIGGFLLSLLGTGLHTLWATRHATSVLLGSAGVLVVLINAAFQNGQVGDSVAWIVRSSARVAACLLLPITVLAVYALHLRVQEYGWTSDRIIVAFCLMVATCYTLGYAWAAAQSKHWLAQIARVNVFTAFVILAVLLALFSPIADPARISVANQLARLAAGLTSAEKFDYTYLRFEGGRYGKIALEQMQQQSSGKDAALIAERAKFALQLKNRWERLKEISHSAINLREHIEVWPKGTQLPADFLAMEWDKSGARSTMPCIDKDSDRCDAYLIDLTQDGTPEIVLIGREVWGGSAIFTQEAKGKWVLLGSLSEEVAGCVNLREQLQAGNVHAIRSSIDMLQLGDQKIFIENAQNKRGHCPGEKNFASPVAPVVAP